MSTSDPLPEETRYLVRLNGEILGMVDTKDDALEIMKSVASSEEKKLSKPGCSVFWLYLKEGSEVQLHTQTHGRVFQGNLVPEVTIDIYPVTRMKFVSPYADKIARFKAEKSKPHL